MYTQSSTGTWSWIPNHHQGSGTRYFAANDDRDTVVHIMFAQRYEGHRVFKVYCRNYFGYKSMRLGLLVNEVVHTGNSNTHVNVEFHDTARTHRVFFDGSTGVDALLVGGGGECSLPYASRSCWPGA